MMKVNFSIGKIWLSARELLGKRISTKLVIVIVLIVLMPYILRYLNFGMIHSRNPNVQTLLFSLDSKFQSDLDSSKISDELRRKFENQGTALSQNVTISIEKKGSGWLIHDKDNRNRYGIGKEDGKLNVYARSHEGLGIKDLVRRVKLELCEAEREMEDNREAALFELKDFDLEISFVVQARSTQKGKVEYHFITVDSEIQTGLEKVQKIKLHWTTIPPRQYKQRAAESPLPAKSEDIITHDRPPSIRKGGKP